MLLCTFVSQTSHCLQVRCKAAWARCQSGVSHKIPCSTSSTRPRLLAEPGAVQYNTESRCPLNSVRVAVKETEELSPFTFPTVVDSSPAQETTALIWSEHSFSAFLLFHAVMIFGDFDSSIVEKTANYNPRNSASVPDIDCFCHHWRTALIGHRLDMIEINPFAPRWENSVKEKMHSCFSTSGSWMASLSLRWQNLLPKARGSKSCCGRRMVLQKRRF